MKKIAKWLIAGSIALPQAVVAFVGLSGCTKNDPVQPTPDIPEDITITTTRSRIDIDKGCAPFEIMLPVQPKNNKVLVTVAKHIGSYDIRLVESWDNLGIGVSSYEYNVENQYFSFFVGFKDFLGVSGTATFDLLLEYYDQNGNYEYRDLKKLQIFVDYSERHTNQEMHILSMNDLHGAIPGFGDDNFQNVANTNPGLVRVADKMGETMEEYPGSFLISGGDNTTGDAFSTVTHGESALPVLREMGVRYSAVGNHEFDWGHDHLADGTYDKWARTPKTNGNYYVCGNVLNTPFCQKHDWEINPDKPKFETDFNIWNNDRIRWADPYKLINADGHLICLLGLTTNSTLEDGNQDVVNHYSFIDYNAAVCYSAYLCKKELGEQWFNSIDSFIVLAHLECDQQITMEGDKKVRGEVTGAAAQLAHDLAFDRVDAILAGHSHKDVCGKVKNRFGKEVWIGQGKNQGRQFVDTELHFNNTLPVGQRLVSIGMDVKDIEIDGSELIDTDPEEAWKEAHAQLDEIYHKLDKSKMLESTIAEYHKQSYFVDDILEEEIAKTERGLSYSIFRQPDETIGHTFYRPQTISEELGSWACLAQLLGFSELYKDDLDISTSSFKYPAISFINYDSLPGEIPAPAEGTTKSVTLDDLFRLQPYENTMTLGYLSVWQLANIINYMLAGGDEDEKFFNYSMNHEYYSSTAPTTSRNNLSYVSTLDAETNVNGNDGPIQCIDQYEMVDYKGEKRNCNYACGPLQWYGFKFEVVKNTDEQGIADKTESGREYRLKYEEITDSADPLYGKYTAYPKIWIYVPYEKWSPQSIHDGLYNMRESDSYKLGYWVSAHDWLVVDKYIPCLINSFTYTGGNAQATMFNQYFNYNAGINSKLWKIQQKVDIGRDLMINFCKLTYAAASMFSFDLPKDTYKDLVVWPNP